MSRPLRALRVGAVVGAALLLTLAPAWAQNVPVPKFEMGKPPEGAPAWTAQAKGSLIATSGNSQSRSGLLGLAVTRLQAQTKVAFDGQVAYGRSDLLVPRTDPANPMLIVGLDRRGETTTDQWQARLRTDHFFTENNALYLLAQIGADQIAGKRLVGGGQIGYSRQVHKDERHTAVAELGYDFSYEGYVQPPGKSIDAVQIHSARLFVGEQLKLSEDTGLTAGFEALFNLNREKALNAADRSAEVAPFKDTRLVGKLGLATKLWRNLSFAFGFTLKYDQNPALQPLPASTKGATFAPTFEQPFAEKVDTLTEASLVFTFL